MRLTRVAACCVALSLLVALSAPAQARAAIAHGFQLPLDEPWDVLQDFGVWNSYWSAYHRGEDVLRTYEAPVYAAADGVVKVSSPAEVYGHVVIIEHELPSGEFVCTLYGHLKPTGLPPRGARVARGEPIGRLSSSTAENGGFDFTHVHFAVRRGAYTPAADFEGYGSAASRARWYDPGTFVAEHAPARWPLRLEALWTASSDGWWLRLFSERFAVQRTR